ncbi:MAG: serine/threonine-protein kinase RsbW [Frankiales bacterium]|jgi:anti-sigma regulatory factor (Ser/Thr protein kinase)|nr:serine/threonine-protein kinase RsbW [Frankiales bacterium]
MAAVEVSFTPLPAHVRTARLIAAAVARRLGIEGALLDEIRLAVGEACSRAVAVHQRQAPTKPVTLTILDENDSLVVTVIDTAGDEQASETQPPEDPFELLTGASSDASGALDVLPSGFGLAVIAGLVDDLDVVRGPSGTVVRMSWKSPERDATARTTGAAEESPN